MEGFVGAAGFSRTRRGRGCCWTWTGLDSENCVLVREDVFSYISLSSSPLHSTSY